MNSFRQDRIDSDQMSKDERLKILQSELPDVQNRLDSRNITIDRAGIQGLLYPLMIQRKSLPPLQTVTSIDMQCVLHRSIKGVSMSKFIDIIHAQHEQFILSSMSISPLMETICEKLGSTGAFIKFSFPFFVEKFAPSSNSSGYLSYHIDIAANRSNNNVHQVISVSVPIMSVCPSSVELAQINSHNQRSIVSVAVRYSKDIYIEDLIKIIESIASSELYSSMKRIDEQHVTREAFKNPKFVEDVVRDVVVKLNENMIEWYIVTSRHIESIHNHQAYAKVIRPHIEAPTKDLLLEI